MNIFVLDQSPDNAARMLCDKHVVKMCCESAQLLSTVCHANGIKAPYKATHKSHPCTVWAGVSQGNWEWLINHSLAMCAEYTHRYGKTHASQRVIEWCRDNAPEFSDTIRTPFAQAMPDQYKSDCAVVAYRKYYHGEKAHFAKWTNRAVPRWWEVKCGSYC